jgi:hypothetical protein
MAVPHYAYLVLKIPGPHMIIMIKGNFEVSDTCDKKTSTKWRKPLARRQNMHEYMVILTTMYYPM